CFNDITISDYIQNRGELTESACNYCGSNKTFRIELNNLLIPFFEPIVPLFELDEKGEPTVALIDKKWSVFSEKISCDKDRLLKDIVKNSSSKFTKEIAEKTTRFREDLNLDQSTELWNRFSKIIETENRFFYPEKLDLRKRLGAVLQLMEKEIKTDEVFYRARICTSEKKAFQIEKMGAPPNFKSTAGRANPAGIAYLYLADKVKTAINEVRPSILDLITVGKFYIVKDLKVIDFRNISPFQFTKNEDFDKLIYEIPLLRSIGKHLAQPIHSSEANVKYISTQYLCEFIKSGKLDGILYNSALNISGYNLALFNGETARCSEEPKLYSVKEVLVKYD
ncbi:RES family NAD+ phosphorylase, partial [Calditrichota bacterium]